MRAALRETWGCFSRRGGRLLSGAIAFYALLSIAPLFVIAIHVAGLATNEDVARTALTQDLVKWIGVDGAHTVATLLQHAEKSRHGPLASVLSGIVLVYAATRLFSALERSLDQIWGVQVRSGKGLQGKARSQLRRRALAFLMVLVVGAILVMLVFVKATLAATAKVLPDVLHAPVAWQGAELVISSAIATVLFMLVFKVLPNVRIAWRDALRGALVTSIAFTAGSFAVGLYLGRKGLGSTYGAAGSIVMLLLWVHYSAQIFFLGAAYTYVHAQRSGRPIEPDEHALRVLVEPDDEER